MAVVYYTKPNGTRYAYESTAVWDPEKKQSRPVRKYLGKFDPDTGRIIESTGRKGRPTKESAATDESCGETEKDRLIRQLKDENARLLEEKKELEKLVRKAAGILGME